MAYAIPGSLVFTLFLLVAALRFTAKVEKRVKQLEKERLLDPATLVGSRFALERELAHIVDSPRPFSIAEILLADPSRAVEAAQALRSACWHGTDQLFCLDLSRGHFLLFTYGVVDPSSQASYFFAELGARAIRTKIGWAYTQAKDLDVRKKVRAVASAALARLTVDAGYAVELVEPTLWSVDESEELLPLARCRREATSLTRQDFAPLVGLTVGELKRIEGGRGCEPKQAAAIERALSTIEKAIAGVNALRVLELTSSDLIRAIESRRAGSAPPESTATGEKIAPVEVETAQPAPSAPGEPIADAKPAVTADGC